MNRIRVLLAEDHAAIRQSLSLLIESQSDMTVVGEAADGRAAVAHATASKPTVIVLDLSMPEMNGLDATRALREVCPESAVIALTRHSSGEYVRQLVQAGAAGYVLKQSDSNELLAAIRVVARGGQYVDYALRSRLAALARDAHPPSPHRAATITQRETDVLRLMAWGRSNKEIAARLDISIKTVEVHRASAIRKLELRDRIDVLRYALLQGWLDESDGD